MAATNPAHAELVTRAARYYSEKVAAHGATPRGADWNSRESQELRFERTNLDPGVRWEFHDAKMDRGRLLAGGRVPTNRFLSGRDHVQRTAE